MFSALALAVELAVAEIGTANTLLLSTLAGLVTLRIALTAAPEDEVNDTGSVQVCPASKSKGSFGSGRGTGNATGFPGTSQVAPTMPKLFSADVFTRAADTP